VAPVEPRLLADEFIVCMAPRIASSAATFATLAVFVTSYDGDIMASQTMIFLWTCHVKLLPEVMSVIGVGVGLPVHGPRKNVERDVEHLLGSLDVG
jgi:hypothetical protein